MRLKYCLDLAPAATEAKGLLEDDLVSFAPMEAIDNGLGGLSGIIEKPLVEVASGSYNFFRNGDLLLAKVTPCFENGKKAIASNLENGVGYATSEVFVVRPGDVEPRYLNYLFSSEQFRQPAVASMTGTGGLKRVDPDAIKNFELPVSDKYRQELIADFLDDQCGQAEALITEKQQFIDLLKEKRQALISHVVTKGLDPSVEMKDSGVEWLGQIPKHWTLKKFKHVGKAIIGLTYKPENTVDDGGTIVLRSTNIQNSRIKLHDVVRVNSEIPEKLRTKKGDILICSRNGSRRLIGKNAMIDSDSSGLSFGAFTTVFRSEINDFIYYILNSELFNYQAGMFMTTTVNQLTTGMLNNFEFPMPPESEAMEIVSNLSRRVPRIDSLIGEVQSSIKLLEEHRTALISAAVTGKIDLRNKEVA